MSNLINELHHEIHKLKCELAEAKKPRKIALIGGVGSVIANALQDASRTAHEPVEQPEAAQDDYVAWMRYEHYAKQPTRIMLCDSDEEGAFKVYRHPAITQERVEKILLRYRIGEADRQEAAAEIVAESEAK